MEIDRVSITESKLYNYFNKAELCKGYAERIANLEKNIIDIEGRLKNVDIILDADIQAINYSESVQTSNDGIGYAEKQLMIKTQMLINERARIKTQIVDMEIRKNRIKSENIMINNNITTLDNESKDFINYRYKENKTNKQISYLMNISQSTVSRVKFRALRAVNNWEDSLLFKTVKLV